MKLNLGGGRRWLMDGWTNLDKSLGHDFNDKLLDMFDDNSVDVIYTSHFLEHLTFARGLELLKDCYHALRPSGLIRVVLPDTERLWVILAGGDRSVLEKECAYYRARPDRPLLYDIQELFGFVGSIHHKSWYSPGILCSFLAFAGFPTKQIFISSYGRSQQKEVQQEALGDKGRAGHVMSGFDSPEHRAISLYVEATK